MKIRQNFTVRDDFIITKINENITSLELSDDQSINNVLSLLGNNNSNIENIKRLIVKEKKRKRIIFYISKSIMCIIILNLLLFFFSKNFIGLSLFAGINCIFVAAYSTVFDIERNRQLKNIIN
jgi:hypothetical protein